MAGLTSRNMVLLKKIFYVVSAFALPLTSGQSTTLIYVSFSLLVVLSIWPNVYVYLPQDLRRRLVALWKDTCQVGNLWYTYVTKLLYP